MNIDREALQLAVLNDPNDDTRRLAFADLLDEFGDPQRACDMRLHVQLRAVLTEPDADAPRLRYAEICRAYSRSWRADIIETQCLIASHRFGWMRLKALEHTKIVPEDPSDQKQVEAAALCMDAMRDCLALKRKERILLRALFEDVLPFTFLKVDNKKYVFTRHGHAVKRGFVEGIRYRWKEWAEIHAHLYWRPDLKIKCPECKGESWHWDGTRSVSGKYRVVPATSWAPDFIPCTRCSGVGHLPMPVPPQAHPIRTVTLMDAPPEFDEQTIGGINLDTGLPTARPVVCGKAVSVPRDYTPKMALEARWPGITFVLP